MRSRRELLVPAVALLLAIPCTTALLAQDTTRRRGFSIEITEPENQELIFGKTKIAAKVEIDDLDLLDRVEFIVGDEVIFIDREALDVYERIDTSDRVDLAINRGVCAARLGHDLKAVEAYRRAIELEPGHRTAQLYLANSHLRLGQREQAVTVYKAFLEHGTRGEAAERVRRILNQIAPEAVAESHDPLAPVKAPAEEAGTEGS